MSGPLQGEYHKRLKSLFYGDIVPKYHGRTVGAFEEYLELLNRRRPLLRSRRRILHEEKEWAERKIGIPAQLDS